MRDMLLLCVLTLATASWAQPDDPVARLEALLAASDTFHARFHQVLLDADGAAAQEADGSCARTASAGTTARLSTS